MQSLYLEENGGRQVAVVLFVSFFLSFLFSFPKILAGGEKAAGLFYPCNRQVLIFWQSTVLAKLSYQNFVTTSFLLSFIITIITISLVSLKMCRDFCCISSHQVCLTVSLKRHWTESKVAVSLQRSLHFVKICFNKNWKEHYPFLSCFCNAVFY